MVQSRYGTYGDEVRWFSGQKPPPLNRLRPVFHQLQAEFSSDKLRKTRHISANAAFNGFIGVIIILNTVVVGIEVDYSRGSRIEDKVEFFLAEILFGFVFAFETATRVHRDGWTYFEDAWNLFDYCLVVLSISDIFIATANTPSVIGGKSLRVLRFLRVVRSIRGLKAVSGLWIIIQGLLDSWRTVFWVFCICVVLIYCCAVALTTVCGQDGKTADQWRSSDIYVGSVTKSMLTVLQIITLDNWTEDVGRPLVDASPLAFAILLGAIVVLSFGTLNILVAVMVDRISMIDANKKESSQKLLERTEHALLDTIAADFDAFDSDGDGFIGMKEFRKMIRSPALTPKLALLGVNFDEAESLFEVMDADRSGTLSSQEFINGLLKVKGAAKGMDVVHLISFAQKEGLRAARFVELVRQLSTRVDVMLERMEECGIAMSTELLSRNRAADREEKIWRLASHVKDVYNKIHRDTATNYPILPQDGDSDCDDVLS
eukprot:TRINITY_DN31230_c0_g1_i1.p1 TRINITY_DN31230_c0_g1~~TRINITY_DN31230_c0_g1_i1.p1  ORF type:complete len:488 (-),score=48.74 TRINITY_DN31230_c0_g1_i1:76-1539(-)